MISVVIPFYNEEHNVTPLMDEVMQVPLSGHQLEGVLIDDGSTDNTWTQILKSTERYSELRGVRLPKNRGQSFALLAGLKSSTGDVLITLDGDGQNDPRDIPILLSSLETCDVVCGIRTCRKDPWTRRASSMIANKVRNWITHDGVTDAGCSLKVFRRRCISDLPPFDGVHRFMPAYFRLNNRVICQESVHHRPRLHGKSKYTHFKRLPHTLFDLIGFVWYRRRLLSVEEEKGSPWETHQQENHRKKDAYT